MPRILVYILLVLSVSTNAVLWYSGFLTEEKNKIYPINRNTAVELIAFKRNLDQIFAEIKSELNIDIIYFTGFSKDGNIPDLQTDINTLYRNNIYSIFNPGIRNIAGQRQLTPLSNIRDIDKNLRGECSSTITTSRDLDTVSGGLIQVDRLLVRCPLEYEGIVYGYFGITKLDYNGVDPEIPTFQKKLSKYKEKIEKLLLGIN